MADLPPPPPGPEDNAELKVINIIHKVKSRLGYTEMISPTNICNISPVCNQLPLTVTLNEWMDEP